MGIDSVAIKTFNASGSQSVCRASEADETKLIESQFISKCSTKYINGSGISFIPGKLTLLPVAGVTSNETFTLPSDVDAISEIIFHCEIKLALADGHSVKVSSSLVLDMINKIEMKIGNLVFQTIRPGDIYARNITEHGHPLKFLISQSDAVVTDGTSSNPIITITEGGSTATDNVTLDFSMSIPFTGRNSNTDRCFLQAGASTNSLSMKVYYNQFSSNHGNTGNSKRSGFFNPHSTDSVTSVSTGICVLSHQITNTEKNFIQKNIINRVVDTSQSVEHYFSGTDLTAGSSTLTIDLSNININVSHILLSLATTLYGTTQADVLVAENSTQGTSWTPRESFRPSRMAATDLGVQSGWLKSAEMVLGNDRTGNIPASCLSTNRIQQFNLKSADNRNLFIIKLADCAFSTAGIPFARLNNKKLIIKFADGYINSGNSSTPLATCVHVTCCGTQIQTTVGGAISFSA